MTPIVRRGLWAALAVLAAVLALVAVVRFGPGGDPGPQPEAARILYHCPMHPTMISEQPGDCPICGMRMVPVEGGAGGAAPAPVPDPAEATAPGGGSAPAGVAGLARVHIPERKQQLIGVRTSPVERRPFVRRIRAVGRVTADEKRLHHVHTKVEGWIETLHVNATGEQVSRGQPLMSLYSPELLATQEEYLLALRSLQEARAGALTEVARGAESMVESARRRLLLFDLAPEQIAALEAGGKPERTLTLYSPISGFVTERNVTQGEKIDSATKLLDIADLSNVWVIASVYEYELPFVREGQKAEVSLSYLPGRVYRGRVTLVYPVLEGATRTVQVRVELPNPELALKPEMYAEVELLGDLGEKLALPESAIISSGVRHVVFVALPDGVFEPRVVRLGLRLPDLAEVLEGVREGERVVTAGNFFVDSESRLKAAIESAAPPAAHPH